MLRRRNRRRGLFVKLAATEVLDITARSGVDFVVVDLEHSQLSEADGLRLMRHAAAIGLPALARVPELDRGAVNRLLEAGADVAFVGTTDLSVDLGLDLARVRERVEAIAAAAASAGVELGGFNLDHPDV